MDKVWMFHIPGCYAAQVPEPVETEADARAWVRRWLNVKRVPAGTEFYQNNPTWASDIARQNRQAGFSAVTDF